ncbi:Protein DETOXIFICATION 29 [Linum perenne]
MGSALETLCGQAYGAGQLDMLGVYMQRSWVILLATFVYIVGGSCGRTWNGFTWKAFRNLWGFVRLSLASAVMVCLEIWYFMALILFAGYLKDAEVSVAALSICMNILGWTIMAAFGMNAAISVRISNELGAGHPRTAKFALMVAVISSFIVGFALAVVLVVTRDYYPSLFSNDSAVKLVVSEMTPLLALCIVINNVQPVLSDLVGVAIGAGWQAAVAYVNIGCYYVFGIPLGLILGYKIEMGVSGIWYGMMAGTVVQTLVLYFMIYKTNWNTEASIAEDRIKQWGGDDNPKLESH